MYPPCFAMPSCRFCLPVLSIVTTGSFCVPTAQCRLKRKGHIMKIKYAFLDGTVTEVEVSDEIGAVIIDSRKAEHAQDERHRYHCYHAEGVLSYIAAAIEEASFQSVSESIEAGRKKFLKIFRQTP